MGCASGPARNESLQVLFSVSSVYSVVQCYFMISTPGKKVRDAVAAEKPLQVIGTINAYHARLAERTGYKAIYLSGGGVAAGSLGVPDLGITTLEDVLTDVRRITDVCELPLLVDVDTVSAAPSTSRAPSSRSSSSAPAPCT